MLLYNPTEGKIEICMQHCFLKPVQIISILLLLMISLICFKNEVETKMEEYAKSWLSTDQQNSSGFIINEHLIYY
jgi:hypothetical protein